MTTPANTLSHLERSVLLALAEADPERETLLAQLHTATVIERDYTGVGLYTKLAIAPDVPKLLTWNRSIEDYPKAFLSHPKLEAGVSVILWLDAHQIHTIEFYTNAGDWPQDETLFEIKDPIPSTT